MTLNTDSLDLSESSVQIIAKELEQVLTLEELSMYRANKKEKEMRGLTH